jgi:hypothetical protein
MCPAVSPAGVESAPRFSRGAAADILGIEPAELRRWERVLLNLAGLELGSPLSLADVVALAVLGTTVRCLGAGADAFAVGNALVFDALRDRVDIERLDGYVALVGRDSARIVERYDSEASAAGDVLVIPLRPILADFRNRVFA